MLEWCMAHPWMIFTIVFIIVVGIITTINNQQTIKMNSQRIEASKLLLKSKEGEENS